MILFKANGRCAAAVSDEKITSGSAGIEVTFQLSEVYDDLAALAVFRSSAAEATVILLETICTVPAEVLAEPGGDLLIGVYARDGEGKIAVPTVWAKVGPIVGGATPELPETPPTPDWTAQVELALHEAVDALEAETGRAAQKAADAENSATLAESWAVGGTGTRAGENYNNSKFYAAVAQQGAEKSGYAWFDVNDQTGQMMVTITNDLAQDVSFLVNENLGTLEVHVNG